MSILNEKNIGWKIPVGVDEKTGAIKGTDIETDISQSIVILLNTRPGERIGHPLYGANLLRFTFENIGNSLIKEISDEIKTAIKRWEQRVENVEIDVSESGDKFIFRISYNIIESGIRSEALYEFFNSG